ncbi:cytochrome P450 [Paraburkholderia phymatum]|uniref:cytochrome P450 n=1 Tax=Paraburkholderia phymatum TaxID=148447 RepID=UPI0031806AEB
MKYTDLASAEFYRDPYPLYQHLRQAGPFIPIAPNTLMTGRAEIVRSVLLDRKMGKAYLQAVRSRYGEAGVQQRVFQALSRTLLMMNPPTHTRLRALLMKAFNTKQIDSMREMSQATSDELIDALPTDGPFDLVSGFTTPMPVRLICKIMDMRVEDALMLGAEVSKMGQALEAAPLNTEQLAAANAANVNLEAYFKDLVAARRKKPGSDLISMLLSVNDNGDTLTEEEVVSNVLLVFAAGHETTGNMIGNALIALHRHPDQLEKLRAHPELLPSAINECIRFDSSLQAVQRIALEDTEIAGIPIPRGTLVMLSLGAANRDPAQYAEPEKLTIDRPETTAIPLMFAAGIHYCIGARLAMLELESALGTILRRLPTLRLTNLDNLEWQPRNVLRGVKSLMCAV